MNELITLSDLENRVRAAKRELQVRLIERWPIGSEIKCNLMSGQKRPSTGVVTGHYDGHLIVRINSAKRAVKYVDWENVK